MVVEVVGVEEVLVEATALVGGSRLIGGRVWIVRLTHIILLYLYQNWR